LIFRFSVSSRSFSFVLQRVLSVWSNCGYSASHIFLLLCVRRKNKRTQTHPLEKRIRDTSKPKVFISFSLVHAGIPLSSTKHHHHSLAQIFEANAFVSAYQTNKEETSRLFPLCCKLLSIAAPPWLEELMRCDLATAMENGKLQKRFAPTKKTRRLTQKLFGAHQCNIFYNRAHELTSTHEDTTLFYLLKCCASV